ARDVLARAPRRRSLAGVVSRARRDARGLAHSKLALIAHERGRAASLDLLRARESGVGFLALATRPCTVGGDPQRARELLGIARARALEDLHGARGHRRGLVDTTVVEPELREVAERACDVDVQRIEHALAQRQRIAVVALGLLGLTVLRV